MKKLTYEEVKNYIEGKSIGFELITENYDGIHSRLCVKDKNGYYYYTTMHDLKRNNKPVYLAYAANPHSMYNIRLWCKLNNKPFVPLKKNYINANYKFNWLCLKKDCGQIFVSSWSSILSGRGCGVCSGRQVKATNCLAIKYKNIAKEWHPTKNGDLTPYDIAGKSSKYVWWICSECNNEWNSQIKSRTKFNGGCPECTPYIGEKAIKNYFIHHHIKYISQKKYKNLKGVNGGNLSYDFYLPDYNLLIEYQGEQHERPIDFSGKGERDALNRFKKQQEHDRRKKEYVENNKINFLEIWYYDYDNIEEILDNFIRKINKQERTEPLPPAFALGSCEETT